MQPLIHMPILRWKTSVRFSSRFELPRLCWPAWAARRYGFLPADVSYSRNLPDLETIILQSPIIPEVPERVDRTILQATITNENRKLHLDRAIPASFAPELTDTRASSLLKMSAGIGNPRGYNDLPARSRAGTISCQPSARRAGPKHHDAVASLPGAQCCSG